MNLTPTINQNLPLVWGRYPIPLTDHASRVSWSWWVVFGNAGRIPRHTRVLTEASRAMGGMVRRT